jgi:hypothetical protein
MSGIRSAAAGGVGLVMLVVLGFVVRTDLSPAPARGPVGAGASPRRHSLEPGALPRADAAFQSHRPQPVMPQDHLLYVAAQMDRYRATGSGGVDDRIARWAQIAALGFAGVRLAFSWPDIEPGKGEWQWALHDSIVGEAAARGVKVYGLLRNSPPWARPPGSPETDRPIVGGSAKGGDVAFAHYAAEVARHFRGRVDAWEVWNEPNVPKFWAHMTGRRNSGPSAADYVTLFNLARDSIVAADSSAVVVSGGLSSGSGRARRVLDPYRSGRMLDYLPANQFLEQMIEAGFQPQYVGLHPYSNVPPGVIRRGDRQPVFPDLVLNHVVNVLNERGFRSARIWVTEWGVNIDQVRGQDVLSAWLEQGLSTLQCDPRIDVVTFYTLTDPKYGLVQQSGELTAEGIAFKSSLKRTQNCR